MTVAGVPLLFIRQRVKPGWEMPWSMEDVGRMLSLVPRALWAGLTFVILRQPTRRESSFHACVRHFFQTRGRWGSAIVLNAVASRNEFVARGGDLDVRVALRNGAVLRRDSAGTRVGFGREAGRAFLLYHVLLHEVGHLSGCTGGEEAEAFAVEWERRLRRIGVIPFGRRSDLFDAPTRRHGWKRRTQLVDKSAMLAMLSESH